MKKVFGIFILALAAAVFSLLFVDVKKNNSGASDAVNELTQNAAVPQADGFSDGLNNSVSMRTYKLDEEGAGLSQTETFAYGEYKIIRNRYENGTAHFYYEYKIEHNEQDITPSDLRTIEGADCALQKIKFVFSPSLEIIKISRPWEDSWNNPTMAVRTVYKMVGKNLEQTSTQNLEKICDVKNVF